MLVEPTEIRATNQRLAGLQHRAQQQRLPTEADVEPYIMTCKHTEDVVADRAKEGDNRSFAQVVDGPTCLNSFGMIAEPL